MDTRLNDYISKARNQHLSDKQIKQNLLNAGWQEHIIINTLQDTTIKDDTVYPSPEAITQMTPVSHLGMWTGFLYIIFFISLYVLASSIAGIFHIWTDALFPNNNNLAINFSHNYAVLRGLIAAIIVSYPVFLTLSLILRKQLIKQPLVKNLRSRKILIYLTLIGTFLLLIGHIIITIYDFLNGSLTINVIGHVFVTFLIAGSLFGYYLQEVQYDKKTH